MSPKALSKPERVFRALLLLHPTWFREAHGEEMAQLFRARAARVRGARAWTRLWWRVLVDAVQTALALRQRGRRSHDTDRRPRRMDALLRDIRYAARNLIRTPVFTLGGAALLAVGIGANTTVFTIVDAMLFRPPPWTSPEQVVFVYQDSDDGEPSSSSYPATRDMADSDVFSSVAAMSSGVVTWESADGPQAVTIEYTTASYMDVLGLSPQRGRWFGTEHDLVGSAPVAVVSAPTWRNRFASDPGVVGRTIRLNGQPVTIIGVGPDRLNGTYSPMITDFWLSISATVVGGDSRVGNLERRQDHWYDARARLAAGVSVDQAQAAMDVLAARLAEAYPELNRGREITVFSSEDVRFHPSEDGDILLAGGTLSALAAIVLLLACANLANLLLVRGLGRSGEVAVRRAMGAGRVRVARLFVVESLLLAGFGGALGILIARWALAAVPAMPIDWPLGAAIDLHIGTRVLVFAFTLVAATGVLFGLAPALRSARTEVAQVIRDHQAAGSAARGTTRLRGLLVSVQVAASLVLVVSAGLLVRSLSQLQGVDTGIDADRVAFVRADLTQAGLAGDDARVALDQLLRAIAATPGVELAAAGSRLPAQSASTTTTVVEGYQPAAGTDAIELSFAIVSDGYFEALGIPLLQGRSFDDSDVLGGPTSILLNESAARTFWGVADPLGRRLRAQTSETWRTVVGIVGDAPVSSLGEAPRPIMYFTTRQATITTPYLFARTSGQPELLVGPMRERVGETRSSITVTSQGTLASHLEAGLQARRFATSLLGAFSLLAVVLAALGIYAVVSFSVARRTAEMGIRMALGAERTRVVRLVVGEMAGTVVLGLVMGVAASVAVASQLGDALYGVGTLDPVTFIGALAFLVAVALGAAYLPAHRAARTDPARALRTS